MPQKRIIPILQMLNGSLVKTKNFNSFDYIGDPVNTARMFNELQADELSVLDIRATVGKYDLKFETLQRIAEECFIPLSYGGGINSLEKAARIFEIGFEKIIINSAMFHNPSLIEKIVCDYGSQAVVGSIDFKSDIFNRLKVYTHSAKKSTSYNLYQAIEYARGLGVGEIFLTDVSREGRYTGLNKKIFRSLSAQFDIPIICHGGANSVSEILSILKETDVDAVGVGSLVVYQKKNCGVLVNYSGEFKKFLWQPYS